MRFALRYWTRRSAATIAVPCAAKIADIEREAAALRDWANEHELRVFGEAFLRYHRSGKPVLHLPVELRVDDPCPPLRVGRIDHGAVVAAYGVTEPNAPRVGRALLAQLRDSCHITGPLEYHFDPSVGRADGIVVVPVAEHPADKAAFVSCCDAVPN